MTYIEPFTLLFLSIMAVGLYGLRHHWRSISWRIVLLGFLGFVALSWPPASEILASAVTGRYVRDVRPAGDGEVIVVLAGAVNYPTSQRPYMMVGRDSYRRVLHAAWLYHNWRPVPVLVTGGPQSRNGEAAAVVMRRLLEHEDIPPSKIWTEEQSQTTYENAFYSAKILHARGIHQIALVVEADSMLRAELCFRKQGLAVTPAPCLFRDYQFGGATTLPGWQGIYRQELLLHEGLGLLWYAVRGRI